MPAIMAMALKIKSMDPITETATPLYQDMEPYAQKRLPATNFWRIANGLEPITVPKSDTHYYTYFTPAYEQQAKDTCRKILWKRSMIVGAATGQKTLF